MILHQGHLQYWSWLGQAPYPEPILINENASSMKTYLRAWHFRHSALLLLACFWMHGDDVSLHVENHIINRPARKPVFYLAK